MESEVAVHTNEGSPEAQSALAALANTLNINENALKTALSGAFDLLPTAAGIPMLALHLSFVRLSYHIDSKTLYEIMGAFRQTFGAALSMERVDYATTQAVSSQYHGSYRAPPTFAQSSRNISRGPPQYPTSNFRSSNEAAHHQHAQVGPPPWYVGYTGNVSSSGPQPADQRAPALRGYQHPGMSAQGNQAPSFPPGASRFARYK